MRARETLGLINVCLLVTNPDCQTILPTNDITVQAESQTQERNNAKRPSERLFLLLTTVFSSAVILEPDWDEAEELRQNSENCEGVRYEHCAHGEDSYYGWREPKDCRA